MSFIDVTIPIRDGMPVYDRNPGVRLRRARAIADGDVVNISELDMGTHTGTHVDAPVHFIEGGAGAESLDPGALIGEAHVIDATSLDGVIPLEGLDLREVEPGRYRMYCLALKLVGSDGAPARVLLEPL